MQVKGTIPLKHCSAIVRGFGDFQGSYPEGVSEDMAFCIMTLERELLLFSPSMTEREEWIVAVACVSLLVCHCYVSLLCRMSIP
jgi:hypothetical protein